MTTATSMITLGERVSALPDYQQNALLHFLEYLEWKAKLPGTGYAQQDNRALGERLRAVRTELQQTEDDAAAVAGVALVTYQRYEKGTIGRWATLKYLRYADTWNVSVDWLTAGTGTMFRGNQRPDIAPSVAPATEPAPAAISACRVRRGSAPAEKRAKVVASTSNVVALFGAPAGKA